MEQGTGKGLGGGWTLRSSSLSTLWKWLACEWVQSVEKVFFESLPAPMYFPISARMIIKVNSPWKNTCQYASCTFFSLYSRKAKFLRLARERCRWTELYLKEETRENIRGSRLDLSRSVRGSCSFRFCRGLYTRDYFYSTLGTEIYRNERNSFVWLMRNTMFSGPINDFAGENGRIRIRFYVSLYLRIWFRVYATL